MISIPVVFYDIASGVKWDTSVFFLSEDGEDYIPPEGSEQFKLIIQHAVENIWGNMCIWKSSGRYDTGHVEKKRKDGIIEHLTTTLNVSARRR